MLFPIDLTLVCYYQFVYNILILQIFFSDLYLGRYCGQNLPPQLISTGSRLWLEYRRSAGSMTTGFIADYEGDN